MSEMRCHPARWFWGLIPIALFSAVGAFDIKGRVEDDLTKRTLDALGRANHGWAKVRFDGRDGTLSGLAADESEPGRAIEVATDINGVRVLDGRPDLLRKADPFVWAAAHRDNKLVLTGFVPSEAARKQIVGAAKLAFPKADIDDKLELARGSPVLADWMDGVRFALKQLAVLKSGKAALSGLAVSLEGEAPSAAVYKDVTTALTAGLPKMLERGAAAVTAPVVSPYTWAAKLAANQVLLSGYVPSEKSRDDVLAHARKAFGKTPVVDKLDVASGAPEDYDRAVRVAIDQLATLQDGSARLDGRDLTLTGTAADEALAEATRKSFRADAPKAFKLAEAIKAARPVASPYVTRIDAAAGSVDVTGFVPNETARATLVAALKARFAGRAVNDRLQIAGGEPAGFETCLTAAVGGLGRLGGGQIAMNDKRVEVSGTTEDEALALALPGEVRAAAKGVCETKVNIAYDDAKKRKAAAEAAARAGAEGQAAEKARREAELAAEAQRVAERAAAQAAADKTKSAAALACERDLSSAAANGTVQFERASWVLVRESLPTLKALAEIAKSCTNLLIEIEGHTDSEGIPERNQPLSERRAQAVADFLIDRGVDAARIKAVGYGDTRPIAPNDTAENRARNRRIAFSVKGQ